MKTIELFCGTKSFSKVAENLGHSVFTIDNEPQFQPHMCRDILNMDFSHFKDINILWASPPCQAFSVSTIGKNWNKDHTPKTPNAIHGLKLLTKTIQIISELKPKYWYIENPRGKMRKVIDKIFQEHNIKDYRRVTITYCQYGDNRMKPTDIWTNDMNWIPKPMCKNGDSCHEKAPRGSKTGTQGLRGSKERGVIPPALFHEIFKEVLKDETRRV